MRAMFTTIAAGAATLAVAALFGGCVVSDQLTTVTIRPDGSADLMVFTSNVHSNEKGVKAEEELRRYVEEFNAGKDADHVRIAAAGGEILESRWVRNEVPFVNLIWATLPTAAALERMFTIAGEDGKTVVQARFARDGQRRRLTFVIALPEEEGAAAEAETAVPDARQTMANGLSETRIAVTGGSIVDGRGFIVADDKQSALLDPREIEELQRDARGQFEIFLAWELAGN